MIGKPDARREEQPGGLTPLPGAPRSSLLTWYGSLGAKLLLAHLVLVAVATATFLLAAEWYGSLLSLNKELEAAFQLSLSRAVLVAAIAGAAAALVASLFISNRIARPVQRMAAAARHIAAGNYSERVHIHTADPVSELVLLEQCFNEMAASLEITDRHRAELLADVVHELRTPIATLEGYLEGLLDGFVESSPETWARLHDEAGRLRRLVADLQDLSHIETHHFSMKLGPVDPADIVHGSLDLLSLDFADKGLDLSTDIALNLPNVKADRDRAIQALTNLLTNALRYTPAPGKVAVSVTRCEGGSDVMFEVTDTGIGIEADHLPRIFDRFYRVDKSRSRAAGGSGIGLTVTRAVVEAMGGRIRAKSGGLGQGSTFSFTLQASR